MAKTFQVGKEVREEFNFVVGWVVAPWGGLCEGVTVCNPERTARLAVDHSKPVTLERCKFLLEKAREISGRDLVAIDISLSVYSKTPGNECMDFSETCYTDKKWAYDGRTNSLLIWDKGEPVYANDDGSICRDRDAIYDCLGD